jgi:Do/DeqQ family serine protease
MNAKKILTTLMIAMAGGIFAIGTTGVIKTVTTKRVSVQADTPVQLTSYTQSSGKNPGSIDFTSAAAASVHAVVHIKTTYQQKSSVYDDFFGGFWDPWGSLNSQNYKSEPIKASGSGVILSDDGYIVTNNHVVQDADSIEVTLNDNRTYDAKVIGTDVGTDLALIKIEETELPYLSYGNSDSVKVGEWVLAVGNPFNLTSTVTAGIISAKARNLNILGKNSSIESFLQTDAAVNPGNSGGALVNTTGQLIGINAAIASNTGSYLGYSFAIPVNIVKKVVDDLLQYGMVQRAYLGVSFEQVDSKLAKEKSLSKVKGLYVTSVLEDGAAGDAGIKIGDVVTKIGNTDVNSSSELQESVITRRPGDKVVVTYTRDGKEGEVTVTLKNKKGGTDIVKKEDSDVVTLLGATFENITKDDMKDLGIYYGLKISKLDAGMLRSAGIREGFIILSVDKKPIKSTDDLTSALKNKTGGVLIEGIYPNGLKAYYGFGM